MPSEDFNIVARWIEPGEGWQQLEAAFTGTYEEAGRKASEAARKFDADFGDTRNWNVVLYSVAHPEHGGYFELFHGRLQ